MRRSLVSVLVGALAAAGIAAAPADGPGGRGAGRPEPEPDVCTLELVCGEDLAAALERESRVDDHLWYGHVLEIDYRTPERVPGDVASVGAWGDSGLWTGTYLASQSYRYAVAKDALRGPLPPAEREQWRAQRDEALARVREMVDAYHRSVRIARGWRTELDPQVDAEAPAVTYGGGVVQGQEGMLMRSCAPADAPPGRRMQPNKRVFGPFPWEDGKEYVCETAPSRDTYAGTTFGLVTAFDLVGPDDPAMARQIRDDIALMADFLVRYGWNYPRPHGNLKVPIGRQEVPGVGPVPMTDHDFDGVMSPLFVYVPSARLNIAQVARHVTRAVGPAADALRFEALWAEEWATQGPMLAASMEVDAAEPNNGYYKFNLNHLTMSTLARLEQDPVVRGEILRAFGVMDRTVGDDGNAHFEAITWAITGEQQRREDAITHLREWLTHHARISAGAPVVNSARCGADLECVPNDQWDAVVSTPAGDQALTTKPGTESRLRARHPLPVADRPPTDFLWQRPPTQLDGQAGATHAAPGIDFLLPYWTLRYWDEVGTPLGTPFPAWVGPEHQ